MITDKILAIRFEYGCDKKKNRKGLVKEVNLVKLLTPNATKPRSNDRGFGEPNLIAETIKMNPFWFFQYNALIGLPQENFTTSRNFKKSHIIIGIYLAIFSIRVANDHIITA